MMIGCRQVTRASIPVPRMKELPIGRMAGIESVSKEATGVDLHVAIGVLRTCYNHIKRIQLFDGPIIDMFSHNSLLKKRNENNFSYLSLFLYIHFAGVPTRKD